MNLPDAQGDLPICLAASACTGRSARENPELNAALKLLCSAKADVGRRAEKGQFQGQSAISIALHLDVTLKYFKPFCPVYLCNMLPVR